MNETNINLYDQFARLEWLIRRYSLKHYMRHGPMGDPHRGQGRVLAILKMQPEISQRELSYLLDMRPQSLGELLTKLEKNGYITRTPSQDDKRVMNITLTESGKALSDEKPSTEDLFDCLNEGEQASLNDYLRRITETLEKQLGVSADDPHEMHRGARHGARHEELARHHHAHVKEHVKGAFHGKCKGKEHCEHHKHHGGRSKDISKSDDSTDEQ